MLLGGIWLPLVLNWWQISQDDQHYGRPRTYQCDAVVGHNDSSAHPSHFLALNLRSQVQIIEIPGGDASKEKVYLGPLLGAEQTLAPVTLEFRDVNGDSKPDMIVTIKDVRVVFINENGAFRPLKAGENVTL